jgi:hypothetical protein
MITYKFFTNTDQLLDVNRQFNSVIRSSYALWQRQPSLKLSEVEQVIKQRANYKQLDASLIKMAVNQAKNLRENTKVIFGSAKLFEQLKWHKGNITKTKISYQRSRHTGMLLRGSSGDSGGNRKVTLDIANSQILVKPRRGVAVPLKISMKAARHKQMMRLQALCEENQAYFNLQVCDGYICVSFDESILAQPAGVVKKKGRVLSIDSNPNYLGIVVADTDGAIVHKEIIDFKDLNHKSISNNKKKHEKHQAVIHIMRLAAHLGCDAIAVERIDMPSKNHQKGKVFNRLVNNSWHKNLMHNSLRKWCVIRQIRFVPVLAAYSSFVGCFNNPTEFDSIAAAIELNRRARLSVNGQRYDLLPRTFDPELVPTQWKEMGLATLLANEINSWRQLYLWCVNTKFSYRVLYKRDAQTCASHRLCSPKSLVQVAIPHVHGLGL